MTTRAERVPSITSAAHQEPALSPLAARVLETLARVRAATAHQVIAHHWTEATERRTARAGYLVLARLRNLGLVGARSLEPERGSVSREVLFVRDADGPDATRARLRIAELSALQLDTVLQTTEMLLAREREGWRVVPVADTAATFREAALRAWQAGARATEARVREALLLHRADLPVPGRLLARGEGAALEARVVLRAWTLDDAERIADELPLQRVPTLAVELVVCDPALASRAMAVLQRAADRSGCPITVTRVAPNRERSNPALTSQPIRTHEDRLSPVSRHCDPPTLLAGAERPSDQLPLFSGQLVASLPPRSAAEPHVAIGRRARHR